MYGNIFDQKHETQRIMIFCRDIKSFWHMNRRRWSNDSILIPDLLNLKNLKSIYNHYLFLYHAGWNFNEYHVFISNKDNKYLQYLLNAP